MTTLTEIAGHEVIDYIPEELRVSKRLLKYWFKDYALGDKTLDHMHKRINGLQHSFVADLYLQVLNDELSMEDMLKKI